MCRQPKLSILRRRPICPALSFRLPEWVTIPTFRQAREACKHARNGAPRSRLLARVDRSERSGQFGERALRLDPDLVNSVIKAESGFNVRAVSPKGAQGLMQLMPGTASQLGVPNAFDPQANVEGGREYLRELLERYNFDLVKALAAYNAGPQRVEQYGGVPPYYETRALCCPHRARLQQEESGAAKCGH